MERLQQPRSGGSPSLWDIYLKELDKISLKPETKKWYVRRAEYFLKALSPKTLKQITPQDLTQYLWQLGRNKTLEEWQFKQALHAIQILLCRVARIPWCKTFDWVFWRYSEHTLSAQHPTVARDYHPLPESPIKTGADNHNSTPENHSSDDSVQVPVSKEQRNKSAFDEVRHQYSELFYQLVAEIRRRAYSIRTEQAYEQWIYRFILFHKRRDPTSLGGNEIKAYLEYLAVQRGVAVSTQNQALNALVFLYTQVMGRDLDLGEFARAKRPRKLPVVLNRDEVARLLEQMEGIQLLMASLLYGSGLRLMECVR